jgi:DNA-binding NtrC family response regulator
MYKAAAFLGMHRSTLHRKLRVLGLRKSVVQESRRRAAAALPAA